MMSVQSGAPNCLSVVAGVMSVVLQALNRQDALSWASHLYQVSTGITVVLPHDVALFIW